jgi:hypothetical protein
MLAHRNDKTLWPFHILRACTSVKCSMGVPPEAKAVSTAVCGCYTFALGGLVPILMT